MGTMLASFHTGGQPAGGATMPVARLSGAKTERVTTSATSARTTFAALQGGSGTKNDGGLCTVTAVGVNLWVSTAATAVYPTAGTNADGFPVMSGQSITFAVKVGEKIAAIEFT